MTENLELLKTKAWLLFSYKEDPDACVEAFEQAFKRVPEHIIPENWNWFVGPVTKEEEQKRNAKTI